MKLLWFLALLWAAVGTVAVFSGNETRGAIYLVGSGLAYGLAAIIDEMRQM